MSKDTGVYAARHERIFMRVIKYLQTINEILLWITRFANSIEDMYVLI